MISRRTPDGRCHAMPDGPEYKYVVLGAGAVRTVHPFAAVHQHKAAVAGLLKAKFCDRAWEPRSAGFYRFTSDALGCLHVETYGDSESLDHLKPAPSDAKLLEEMFGLGAANATIAGQVRTLAETSRAMAHPSF